MIRVLSSSADLAVVFWLLCQEHVFLIPYKQTKQTNHSSEKLQHNKYWKSAVGPRRKYRRTLALLTSNLSILLFLTRILHQAVLITFLQQMNFSRMQTNNRHKTSSFWSPTPKENYFHILQLSNDSIQCKLHHQNDHRMVRKVPISTEH